jgi:DNA-binding NtrC family response regulator
LTEDDLDTLDERQELLTNMGFDVASATCGREAIRYLSANDCDVLLSDVNIPGMLGPQLAEWTRNNRPGVQVVLMSARPLSSASLHDDWRFLPKPLNVASLAAALAPPVQPNELGSVIAACGHCERAV